MDNDYSHVQKEVSQFVSRLVARLGYEDVSVRIKLLEELRKLQVCMCVRMHVCIYVWLVARLGYEDVSVRIKLLEELRKLQVCVCVCMYVWLVARLRYEDVSVRIKAEETAGMCVCVCMYVYMYGLLQIWVLGSSCWRS